MGKNILMALMKLDIGGAETHVVELSKELKRRGHKIIAVSSGGAYEKELEDEGIKHYFAPLASKKPADILSSRRILKDIIEKEKIDIVHSHARIPSFILSGLHKKMGFPFVTTAHWVFKTSGGLKYLTRWGEKTIAVSEDIKKYLIDNYSVREENITVTVNGVDTEKFSPDTDPEIAKKEFDINDNDNLICYISRLDEDRSLVAKQLISGIEKLDPIVGNIRALIVGGGDDYDNVSELAAEVNKRLKRKAVILTGARTDINYLIAPAKLFIGVSRSALEAMAEEKPSIIAGNEGYIGLFTPEKLDTAIETNFCCRGCAVSTEEKLTQDIGEFFGMWDEDIEKISRFSADTVKKYYSVKRMADDAEKAYKDCLKDHKNK